MTTANKHHGSDFREFLEFEGIADECEREAVTEVISHRLKSVMDQQGITKSSMARKMHTSRSAIDRLLDPTNHSVTLQTLEKAAHAVGCRLRFELEPLLTSE